VSPTTAAAKQTAARTPMCRTPCEARNPAVKSRLSPGRKKPTSRPVSAKMMAAIPR